MFGELEKSAAWTAPRGKKGWSVGQPEARDLGASTWERSRKPLPEFWFSCARVWFSRPAHPERGNRREELRLRGGADAVYSDEPRGAVWWPPAACGPYRLVMARFWVCLAGAGFFLTLLVLHSRFCGSPVSWAVKKCLSGVWIALLRGEAAVVGWRWRALAPARACLQKLHRERNCLRPLSLGV